MDAILSGIYQVQTNKQTSTLCSLIFQTPKGVQLLESDSRMKSGCLGLGGGETLNLLPFETMCKCWRWMGLVVASGLVHSKIVKRVHFILCVFCQIESGNKEKWSTAGVSTHPVSQAGTLSVKLDRALSRARTTSIIRVALEPPPPPTPFGWHH